MISRRDILVGGSCLLAAGSAVAMRPRSRMSLVGKADLGKAIPAKFGDWTEHETNAIVTPQGEDSLAARLYSQIVGRLYANGDGHFVMMLIAYGDTQSDLLQLHRPEICYPAFGFQVTESRAASFALGKGLAIPGRELSATSPQRTEHISYWTRIGQYLPTSGNEQRMMKLRSEIGGVIPDGVLVRFSNAERDPAAGFALNERFAADMVAAVPDRLRPALISTPVARAFAAAAVG